MYDFRWRAEVLIRPNLTDGFAAFWILLICALLVGNLSNAPLWQDEAESALNALTISSASPIPKGSTDGNPALLHEMALYYKANDPKYEYLPTPFLETSYVTIHGWLPYYFIRLGIAIFGKNELGPRFFSVIFFGMALGILYVMLRQNVSSALALCVVAYCSLTPSLLGYAMQARYYSYALFFNLLGVFSFLRFTQIPSRLRFGIWAASEVLLYYTYVSVLFLHQAVFALLVLLSRRDLLKKYILHGVIVCIFALPHLLITKFPVLVLKIPARHSVDIRSFFTLLSALEWNLVLMVATISFLSVFFVRMARNTLRRAPCEIHWNFDLLCFLMVIIGYPLFSYTSPEGSYYPRIFLPIVPFIIYAAFSRISPGGDRNRNFKNLRAVMFSCIFLFVFFNPILINTRKIPDLFTLNFRPNKEQATDSRWVIDALKHIDTTGSRNPLIISSFEHFVFAYYSGYDVDLVWPLRKEYIDRMDRDFFIVTEDADTLRDRCVTFLPLEKINCLDEHMMIFFDRAMECKRIDIGKVRIYQHLKGQR